MTQLTHNDIVGNYTLQWLDQFWTVFTFDTFSTDQFWGNELYFIELNLTSYDLWDKELVFDRRTEAEEFAESVRRHFAETINVPFAIPDVYVINLGDKSRWGEWMVGNREEIKARFKGSLAAIEAKNEMRKKMRKFNKGFS